MVTKMAGASLLSEWLNRVSSRSTWNPLQNYSFSLTYASPKWAFHVPNLGIFHFFKSFRV